MRLAAIATLVFTLGLPLWAAAQPSPQPSGAVDARELFRRGEAAYSAGNYELAIREWKSAYAADARPRIQFNLAQAYERMGDLESAIKSLETFLGGADPDDPTYSDANAKLAALRQRLASTGVLLSGGAEGGQILVDDQDRGRTPRPDKILVEPGSHTLIVKWAGHPEFRTSISVPAGQVVHVALPADAGSGPGTSGPTAASGAQVSTSDGVNPMVLYITGGAAAAVGVGLLSFGIGNQMALSDCGGNTYCNQDDEDSAGTKRTVGLVGGGVLIAAGAGLIVWGLLSGEDEKKQARTACGVGFMSGACRVRF